MNGVTRYRRYHRSALYLLMFWVVTWSGMPMITSAQEAEPVVPAEEDNPENQSAVDEARVRYRAGMAHFDAEPMELSPGRHELALEQDGYLPFRSTVRLEAGLTTVAYADLQPATGYRAVRGRRLWTWIAGGLAVAGGGAAIGLGVHARGFQGDNLPEARRWARYSDIALGAAVAMALTSVILYFIEGRAVETERFGPDESAP